MPDLPEISQDMDQPLPQVDPNSQLVPYRMSRTAPGQAPVITTGYGPRARPPIQPPDSFGGGVGMPNLDQIYQAAFSKLPVEEAAKAVEAATRYVALRGYQRDIQNGMAADQAFTKWGPALFKQATGIPEAFQLKMQQAKMNAPVIRGSGAVSGLYRIPKTGPAETLVAPTPKPVTPSIHSVGGGLYRTGPTGPPEELIKPRPPKAATITVPLDPTNPDGAKITGPADDPDVQDAVKKHEEASKPKPAPQEKGLLQRAKELVTGTPKAKEVIRVTKDGKRAVFDAETKKFIRYAE